MSDIGDQIESGGTPPPWQGWAVPSSGNVNAADYTLNHIQSHEAYVSSVKVRRKWWLFWKREYYASFEVKIGSEEQHNG